MRSATARAQVELSWLKKRFRESIEISRLGKGVRQKGALFLTFLRLACWARLGGRGRAPKTFTLQWKAHAFRISVTSYSDLRVLWHVFAKEEYALPAGEVETVLDLGSHIGLASIYFTLRYPNATVYAVEPDPTTYQLLEANTRSFPRIRPFRFAVAGTDSRALLYTMREAWSSSLVNRNGGKPVEVETRTLESFLQAHGIKHIDILKFDIEGAEYDTFRRFSLKHAVDQYIGEVHPDLMGHSVEEFRHLFQGRAVSYCRADKGPRAFMSIGPLLSSHTAVSQPVV